MKLANLTRRLRRRLAVGVVLLFAAVSISGARAMERREEPVTLPVLKIYPGWLIVTYYATEKGLLENVLITEITRDSPAAKAGLKNADELIAIDQTSLSGMSVDQFTELYSAPLAPGTERTYTFRGYRGWFHKKEVTLKFVVRAGAKTAD